MQKEERELGMEATVKDSDIEDSLKKAEEMAARVEVRKEGKQKDSYYIFQPKVEKAP